MAITIYDIAREAGVGIGTVSRCLNNHPSVSPETREKVLAVARRLSYQPHAHAQRLASRRANTVSTIIPFFTNYFFIEVLQGVQDKAAELGIDLILYGVQNPAEAEYYLRRSLHGGRVDGVMFFSMRFPESFVHKFQQMRLPLVMVDAYHEKFDSLLVKNREGAMQATRHLLSLGHRNIGMINASLDTVPARERLEGYKAALEEANIPFTMERVIVSANGKQDGFNREAGYESMKEMLRRNVGPERVTAVFIASDIQAIGALEAARELGVRVPEDVAVVGFDDIELAKYAQLTTVRQPMHMMGTIALQMLMDRMKNPEMPPHLSTFLPELVIRKTCGASARTERPAFSGGIELEESSN
ncbi:MAG TPA: LacI family DNA-binding transcriptional regulator [Bacteroidota bacterium]|nr:LacI family DNA-binding transcriptional regulator [Bacteroidota bacterium]